MRSAVHASDIPFFLATQRTVYGDQTTPLDDAMADAISRRVISFVKAEPRNPSIEGWPRFEPGGREIMNISEGGAAEVIDDPWANEIDAAPSPRYPGLSAGGAERGAAPTGDPSAIPRPTQN